MDVNTKTSNSELEYFVLHADFSDTVSKVIKNEEKKRLIKNMPLPRFEPTLRKTKDWESSMLLTALLRL